MSLILFICAFLCVSFALHGAERVSGQNAVKIHGNSKPFEINCLGCPLVLAKATKASLGSRERGQTGSEAFFGTGFARRVSLACKLAAFCLRP